RNLWERIHGLRTVIVPENVFAGHVEVGPFLQVVRPIRSTDDRTAGFVVFDRILVDGGIDQAQVIDDAARLRAFAGAKEAGDRDGGEQSDDGHDNHNFDQGKAGSTRSEIHFHAAG